MSKLKTKTVQGFTSSVTKQSVFLSTTNDKNHDLFISTNDSITGAYVTFKELRSALDELEGVGQTGEESELLLIDSITHLKADGSTPYTMKIAGRVSFDLGSKLTVMDKLVVKVEEGE